MRKTAILVAAFLSGQVVWSETVVDQILKSYEEIDAVTCFIRKDTETDKLTVKTLSKIIYQRPDRIHVENSAPVKRRIVADGTNLFYYVEGDPKGFSRPISKLDDEWLLQLQKIPGTAMEHLLRLKGLPEDDLEATEEFPTRKGYQAKGLYAVLSLDGEGRLARIEFYEKKDLSKRTAQIDYSQFQKVTEHVSIPCLHRGRFTGDGVESRETSRVSSLVVNKKIPVHFFDATSFFKGVEFVSSMDEIYPE